MSERAVLYLRVSSEAQADNFSLPSQLASCRAYAAAKGYTVVGEYSDCFTGTELDRPQLTTLLRTVQAGVVNAVVVHDLDRLTRDPGHLAILEMELGKAGARLECVLGDYAATPEGELSKTVKAAIAQYENRQRLERSQRGALGRALAGQVRIYGKRAPYGYRYIAGKHTGRFAVDEQEAAIVRWLFDSVCQGARPTALAAALTVQGVRRSDGKQEPWLASTILRMLRNRTYAGVWEFSNRSTTATTIAVPVPPLVDELLWRRVQLILATQAPPSPKQPYLLSGYLRCACGRAWVTSPRQHRISYYRCGSHSQPAVSQPCPIGHAIRTEHLDAIVWDAVAALMLEPDLLRSAAAERTARSQAAAAHLQDQLHSQVAARQQVDQRSRALLDEWIDERITAVQLEARQAQIQSGKAALDAEILRLQREFDDLAANAPLPVRWETLARLAAAGLTQADLAKRRQVLALLHLTVTVERSDCVRLDVLDGTIVQSIDVPSQLRRQPLPPPPLFPGGA